MRKIESGALRHASRHAWGHEWRGVQFFCLSSGTLPEEKCKKTDAAPTSIQRRNPSVRESASMLLQLSLAVVRFILQTLVGSTVFGVCALVFTLCLHAIAEYVV